MMQMRDGDRDGDGDRRICAACAHTTAWKCPESADRQFLLELSDGMMAMDPNRRPSMKTVVESLDRYVEGHAESVFPSATTLALESHL